MPIYTYRCSHCGCEQDQFTRMAERETSGPTCCDAQTSPILTTTMIAVKGDFGYHCQMSGEVVTTHKRREYLMAKNNVVDARDYKESWKRSTAARAAERAEVAAAYERLPDAVKKTVANTAPN